LQVLTINNYLVSNQNSSSAKKQIDDDLKKRFDYVNSAIIKQTTKNSKLYPMIPSNIPFPPMKPSIVHDEQYKSTEDVLNQIQSLIRK
jgi:hypothetical protein